MLSRQKPIRRVSKKRAAEQRQRVKALRAIDANWSMCERCHFERATDAHELLRRSQGGSITHLPGIKLLCRTCHDWIGAHPRQAVAEGWAITRRGY